MKGRGGEGVSTGEEFLSPGSPLLLKRPSHQALRQNVTGRNDQQCDRHSGKWTIKRHLPQEPTCADSQEAWAHRPINYISHISTQLKFNAAKLMSQLSLLFCCKEFTFENTMLLTKKKRGKHTILATGATV